MILRWGTWSDIVVGKYVVDKSDHTWKAVTIEEAGNVHLIDAEGNQAVTPPMPADWPIRIFDLTEQESIDLVAAVLGGEVLEPT